MSAPASDAHARPGHGSGALAGLLRRNRSWVERKTRADPEFFTRLVEQQCPDYFWIGCSDSRVPATEIVDLDPGEMFVHRNVANLASANDPNFQAALVFAVEALRVRHILVVGHYGCGGVRAALLPPEPGPVATWLSPIRATFRFHQATLAGMTDGESACDRLCELNVMTQVAQLAENPVLIAAWSQGRELSLHGWIYAIGDGLLKPVCDTISQPPDRARPTPSIFDLEWLDCNVA
ncbi:MAG: carbonic anhydrase [Sphingomonas sp.]